MGMGHKSVTHDKPIPILLYLQPHTHCHAHVTLALALALPSPALISTPSLSQQQCGDNNNMMIMNA